MTGFQFLAAIIFETGSESYRQRVPGSVQQRYFNLDHNSIFLGVVQLRGDYSGCAAFFPLLPTQCRKRFIG